jgi:hypothetical protein
MVGVVIAIRELLPLLRCTQARLTSARWLLQPVCCQVLQMAHGRLCGVVMANVLMLDTGKVDCHGN